MTKKRDPGEVNLTRGRTSEPAPEVGYIKELVQEADTQAAPTRKRWELIRQVRSRQHAIQIPEEFRKTNKEVRTHFVGDILRTVKSSLTANFPSFTVPPAGPGDTKQRNSSLREKWSNAALLQMDSARLPKRVWPRLMDHAVTYGVGVSKLVYLPNAWADYPQANLLTKRNVLRMSDAEYQATVAQREEYKQGRLPFAWQAVDPRTWWGFYGEGQLRECVEVSERTVNEITSRYNVSWDGTKLRPGTVSEPYARDNAPSTTRSTRTFVEHWTPEWVTYLCDDVVLQRWRHGYGKVPYFPFYGLSNDTADPGQEMESVVEHILDIVVLFDNLLTMWQNWAYLAAYPSAVVSGLENSGPLQLVDGTGEDQMGPDNLMRYVPGAAQVLPPGWKREYEQPPPVGRDLMTIADLLRQFIERVIPDIMRGVGHAGDAGYALNQLLTAARLVYDPITDNASLSLGEQIKFVWWLLQHRVGEKVYVWGDSTEGKTSKWLGLAPNDIFDYYSVVCKVEPLLPSNLIAEGQFWGQQAQGKLVTRNYARERGLRIENPEEMEDAVIVQDALDEPDMRQWIKSRALKLAGMLDEVEQAKQDAAMAAAPLPPGIEARLNGGPPGMGGGAPGVPGFDSLAPMPGNGMPLQPPPPEAPGVPPGMGGGRAAGVGIQPNTQGLPGGLPMNS